MEAINASIAFDQRLYAQDIRASKAHAAMLAQAGLISAEDEAKISKGLAEIKAEIESGQFTFQRELEDIHMNVEARLIEKIGEPGRRLHTARSRNDQVATDFRLWVREETDGMIEALDGLLDALIDQAEREADTVMPGYTHLQNAQPVTFGHHMLAYAEMILRDRGRLADARKRMNLCPLGAAALAGTGFAIDRDMTASALGFDGPTRNSIDSVSDRDFAMEVMAALVLLSVHLSRLAEEIVLWMTEPFGFITLSDAYTTGSSIMPQKRNPDAAELVRAKTGRIAGDFVSLATVMKGLPLSYSKDMQEDKEVTFDAMDAAALAVAAMTGMVQDLRANRDRLYAATQSGHITATDLADWLVREKGLAFRDAHHVTGALVKLADENSVQLPDLSLEAMQSIYPDMTEAVFEVLSVERSVESRRSFGGTAPARVRAAVAQFREVLLCARQA